MIRVEGIEANRRAWFHEEKSIVRRDVGTKCKQGHQPEACLLLEFEPGQDA